VQGSILVVKGLTPASFPPGRYSASRSLEWLRGRGDQAAIEREIEKIKRDIAFRRQQRVSVAQLGPFWKPFAILLAMNFFLNFSGFNVILFYTTTIFKMARSSIEPKLASVLLAVTLVVSGVTALLIVSRLKRKVHNTNVRGLRVTKRYPRLHWI
jgi:hypothetical protein